MGLDKFVPQSTFATANEGGLGDDSVNFWSDQHLQKFLDFDLVKGLGLSSGVIPLTLKTDSESLRGRSAEELLSLGGYAHVGELAQRYNREVDEMKADMLDVAFFNPSGSRLTADILAEMDSLGLRPLTAHELYALGIIYPDLQREKPLIALGSMQTFGSDVHDGEAVSPFLAMKDGKGRGVDVDWSWKSGWTKECRFPVVRK